MIHPSSRAAVALLTVALVACGGGGSTPSNPSTTPPTLPPATPAPLATDPPLSSSCARLALGMANGQERCGSQSSDFLGAVDQAIEELVAQQPHIFNLNQVAGAGGYKILSEGAFTVGVIKNLDKQGICGGLYGEELAVATNAGYSENFDIVDSDNFIRRGSNTYRSTCTPAAFTTPQAPSGNTPGCNLPASLSLACTREEGEFSQVVEDALDQLAREQPALFDTSDIQKGAPSNWYRVRDEAAYTQGVVRIVLSKGLCAAWDGEELNIKRNNVSSENYDILTAQGYVRRGAGAYQVDCFPAYF